MFQFSGQFCKSFENKRENLSLILLGLMRLHIQSASDPTEIPLQRGPKFNTARRHFESYLATWLHVRDVKLYNETSGWVTWARLSESTLPDRWSRCTSTTFEVFSSLVKKEPTDKKKEKRQGRKL